MNTDEWHNLIGFIIGIPLIAWMTYMVRKNAREVSNQCSDRLGALQEEMDELE